MHSGIRIYRLAKIPRCDYHRPQCGVPVGEASFNEPDVHAAVVSSRRFFPASRFRHRLAVRALRNQSLHRIRLGSFPSCSKAIEAGPMSFVRSAFSP
jgi:hypothetical protein